MANWAQIKKTKTKKQGPAAIAEQGFSCKLSFQEKPALNCLAACIPSWCPLVSEPTLIKEFLELYFNQ